jgi:GNAT superfamily N-acetyltransferase
MVSEPLHAYRIVHAPAATPDERAAVLAGLQAFNRHFVPDPDFKPIVFLLRHAANRIAGGLVGETGWKWLHIHWLWVDESARGRGFGHQLMAAAEREAAIRGCVASWLDTFEFQARGFYEKAGYTLFGTLENYPPGFRRYFLSKQLQSGS